jgi:hypothetical protein
MPFSLEQPYRGPKPISPDVPYGDDDTNKAPRPDAFVPVGEIPDPDALTEDALLDRVDAGQPAEAQGSLDSIGPDQPVQRDDLPDSTHPAFVANAEAAAARALEGADTEELSALGDKLDASLRAEDDAAALARKQHVTDTADARHMSGKESVTERRRKLARGRAQKGRLAARGS